MATFQDLMNFAIATGGNNQITDLNSPTARNAMAAAVNAEARRRLAQQAGKSAVREAQELQRMSQQETTRALPGGVTSSTLPDGYTVLTDAQGKIIGTNRPLSSVVPYAGETVDQARAAINRGESTVADRERLGEALRQSIFQQAPARPSIPPEAIEAALDGLGPVAGKPQQAPYTQAGFLDSLNRSMQPISPKEESNFLNRLQKSMGPSFASQAAPASEAPAPAAPAPAPAAPVADLSPREKMKMKELEARYGGQAAPSQEVMDLDKIRSGLYSEVKSLQEEISGGTTPITPSYADVDVGGAASIASGNAPPRGLTPQELSDKAKRLDELRKLIQENYAKSQSLVNQRQVPEEILQEWLDLRNRASAATPAEAPSQATGPSSLMSLGGYLRDAYQNAMEAAPGPISESRNLFPNAIGERTQFNEWQDKLAEAKKRGEEGMAKSESRNLFPNAIGERTQFNEWQDKLAEAKKRGEEGRNQNQANIDELLNAIATEFNPTSERLSKERNDDLLRAIGLQHNAASEQLRNAREKALTEKQKEWNTSRNPADRVKIWEEIQALRDSLGIPNQSASR